MLAQRLEAASFDLAVALARAAFDSEQRAQHLRKADEQLVTLRVAVRLCADLDLLRDGQARWAHGELDEIGRMVGGWLRHGRESHAD